MGTGSASTFPTGVAFLPADIDQAGFYFSDLDARDSNNRRIVTAEAKSELQDIFRAGLFNLLVNSKIHSIAQALCVIEKELNLGAQSLVRNIPVVVGRIMPALCISLKKFAVHVSFPTLPSFFLPALMVLLTSFCLMPACPRATLLFIRC